MKRYQGSCHCGAVRFEATIDLAAGTMRCNCSFCAKIRCWAVVVQPQHFALLTGEADLTLYQFGSKTERHHFCKHCGVRPFGQGHSPRWGAFFGVNVSCLDDATAAELAEAPVTYLDGANDEWSVPPTETRHL